MSNGAAFASAAVIAITADRNASGADPNTRRRGSPASLTAFSIIAACFAPAQTMKALWFRPAARLSTVSPASSCHSDSCGPEVLRS
jgi:hypothetical protein